MRRTTAIIFSMAALSCAAFMVAACSESAPTAPTAANCAPTDPSCPALDVPSECLALVDNTGKDVFALRVAQLSILQPSALTEQLVYQIVSDGVNLNVPSCNVTGMGTFSWITEFNRTTGKIRSGGAKPAADPTEGYCFDYDADRGVEPVEIESNLKADGSFDTDVIPKVVVPIYLDLSAQTAVYLPLKNARILSARLSDDQNCLGTFNAAGLEPANNCKPDLSVDPPIEYYVNGATLEGHITLEDADEVEVPALGRTLCVLLTNDAEAFGDDSDPMRCKRDAEAAILFEGDWCSGTDTAGGCADAVRMNAELAASAVTIRDDCPAN